MLDFDFLQSRLRAAQADVVFNAVGYTAVDAAEDDAEAACELNRALPDALAHILHSLGHGHLLHYSTDFVFSGHGETPLTESDEVHPQSVYGRTKLEGEQAVARCARHLIFRTSWVYAAKGANFAKTMLRLAKERDQLKVIADQIGAPTGAELLADVTAHAIRTVQTRPDGQMLAGLYHLAAAGETSWHGYALFVIERAQALGETLKAGPNNILPITTADYPTPAQRPANSRLDTTKLRTTFGLQLPDWRIAVERMLIEVLQK